MKEILKEKEKTCYIYIYTHSYWIDKYNTSIRPWLVKLLFLRPKFISQHKLKFQKVDKFDIVHVYRHWFKIILVHTHINEISIIFILSYFSYPF